MSDLNRILEEGGFGWGCLSDDPEAFRSLVGRIIKEDLSIYSKNSREYLRKNFTAGESYAIIMDRALRHEGEGK